MDPVSQITPKERSAPSWCTAAELVLDHPDCTAGELARHAGDECDRARLELLGALHLAVEQGALLIGPVRTCSVRQTLATTWVVSVGLGLHLFPYLGVTLYPLEIAHAIGIAAPVITSYFGHKFLSFR